MKRKTVRKVGVLSVVLFVFSLFVVCNVCSAETTVIDNRAEETHHVIIRFDNGWEVKFGHVQRFCIEDETMSILQITTSDGKDLLLEGGGTGLLRPVLHPIEDPTADVTPFWAQTIDSWDILSDDIVDVYFHDATNHPLFRGNVYMRIRFKAVTKILRDYQFEGITYKHFIDIPQGYKLMNPLAYDYFNLQPDGSIENLILYWSNNRARENLVWHFSEGDYIAPEPSRIGLGYGEFGVSIPPFLIFHRPGMGTIVWLQEYIGHPDYDSLSEEDPRGFYFGGGLSINRVFRQSRGGTIYYDNTPHLFISLAHNPGFISGGTGGSELSVPEFSFLYSPQTAGTHPTQVYVDVKKALSDQYCSQLGISEDEYWGDTYIGGHDFFIYGGIDGVKKERFELYNDNNNYNYGYIGDKGYGGYFAWAWDHVADNPYFVSDYRFSRYGNDQDIKEFCEAAHTMAERDPVEGNSINAKVMSWYEFGTGRVDPEGLSSSYLNSSPGKSWLVQADNLTTEVWQYPFIYFHPSDWDVSLRKGNVTRYTAPSAWGSFLPALCRGYPPSTEETGNLPYSAFTGPYDYIFGRFKYYKFEDKFGQSHGIDGYFCDSSGWSNVSVTADYLQSNNDHSKSPVVMTPYHYALIRDLQNVGIKSVVEMGIDVGSFSQQSSPACWQMQFVTIKEGSDNEITSPSTGLMQYSLSSSPKVTSTWPPDCAIDVDVDTSITVTFDVPINQDTFKASLIGGQATINRYNWSPDGRTVEININTLEYNQFYTFRINYAEMLEEPRDRLEGLQFFEFGQSFGAGRRNPYFVHKYGGQPLAGTRQDSAEGKCAYFTEDRLKQRRFVTKFGLPQWLDLEPEGKVYWVSESGERHMYPPDNPTFDIIIESCDSNGNVMSDSTYSEEGPWESAGRKSRAYGLKGYGSRCVRLGELGRSRSLCKARIIPEIAKPGWYDVYATWGGKGVYPSPHFAPNTFNVKYIIKHYQGESIVYKNQVWDVTMDTWIWLGRFLFPSGRNPLECSIMVDASECFGQPIHTDDAALYVDGFAFSYFGLGKAQVD
ncbi:hypothetical protein ES703_41676 [subsurface metagenome]